MSANDVLLLEEMLRKHRMRHAQNMSSETHAVLFTAQQYLRNLSPSLDDLAGGIVDASDGCGLDGFYIFVNGMCVRDDVPADSLGKRAQLDLCLLQVSQTDRIREGSITRLADYLPRLLAFDRDEHHLAQEVSPRLLEQSRRFLRLCRELEFASIRIFLGFTALRADGFHEQIREQVAPAEAALLSCFSGCQPEVSFWDASLIVDTARLAPSIWRQLGLAENPISTNTVGGYIGVVNLDTFASFITSAHGDLDASLFEANVRDYERDSAVNASIQETLSTPETGVDFWWLNNGVSIVANRVQLSNKTLQLESPQIVNGLQTSHEIFKRSRTQGWNGDSRSLLVKVIEVEDSQRRDSIIQATNSQTSFGSSTLRATDKVQKQIEEYLLTINLFYERRRRYYENRGMPYDRIISVDTMGQALLSILVQLPHIARSNISDIFRQDVYPLVFSLDHPLDVYARSIEVFRTCSHFLDTTTNARGAADDYRFHLPMIATQVLTRKVQPRAQDVARLDPKLVTSQLLRSLLVIVREEFNDRSKRSGHKLMDQIAKDPATTAAIKDRGRSYLLSTPKS